MKDLSRLLHPKTIVVFGAAWAENVIRQCQKIGYAGDIWPVHPTRDQIGGKSCFRSVEDLPAPPDAAFIGVNRHATLDILDDLRRVGCGGAVSFAAGFAEAGDDELQHEFLRRAGDMPVLGPNCYGVINCLDGAIIWPDQQGCEKVEEGVAILSQSSNIGITLSMQRRGLPVAYLACIGNAAQTGLSDMADAFLSDPRVTALGIYMEGVGDAISFANVVAKAHALGKGVVVFKAGQTEKGQAAAMTHTASLAGGGKTSSAYLKQIGASEVHSVPQLIETLKILHVNGPLDASTFISVSCSGGEAGFVADAAHNTELKFPPVPDEQSRKLSEVLGPLVAITNPFDYHTFIWGDAERMKDVFKAALDGYEAALYIIDPPRADTCDTSSYEPAFDAMAYAVLKTGKPAFAVSTLPDTIDQTLAMRLMDRGIVPLLGLADALVAISAARRRHVVSGWKPWSVRPHGATFLLDEANAKELLKTLEVATPKSATAATIAELSAEELTPPFALKGLGFAHKTEAGAVRLNVSSLEEEPLMHGANGYLLEEMITDVVGEVLIGVSRDPVYGASLTLGIGGVATELLGDSVTLIAPVTEPEIQEALTRLKLWPTLNGHRGRVKADVGAIADIAMKLQALLENEPDIIDVEINPLMARESGAIAADALIRKETG
ncbi:MAG: CoA-binding protein [Boseongicola sp.]|nr:MAG: CoA-binding protein [Boseongicola sp.]